MPLYRWNADNLEAVPQTTFEAEQLQERADLQRMLRDQPDVLEEGLFVVAEEFSNWQDSSRSIDLLALDGEGNLVVIELKRTQTGDHSELQAIRYAAMVSNMTLEQVVEAHRGYLARRGSNEDARVQILNHLEVTDEADAEIHTDRPRILLASAGFSKELTASVLWLGDNFGVDIRCVELQLYRDGNGRLLDTNQVIPLPNTEDYQVRVREKQEEVRHQRGGRGRTSGGKRFPGSDLFEDSIKAAEENAKPGLERLFRWAVELKNQDLVSLSSYQGKDTTLQLRLPSVNASLATIFNTGDSSRIELQRKAFEDNSPKSISTVEMILGRPIRRPSPIQDPTDELLNALTDAYREANGLLPTTPHLDTAPDSPLLVD